ncbi:MAG: hypothetical protein QW254_02110 [Desulfurococcaceae archaeon]
MKKESRLLVYGYTGNYVVLITYRRNFIEELKITRTPVIINEDSFSSLLNTWDEISNVLVCTGNKYSGYIRSFKIIEGGDELVLKIGYCDMVIKMLCMLEKYMPINNKGLDFVINPSDICREMVISHG